MKLDKYRLDKAIVKVNNLKFLNIVEDIVRDLGYCGYDSHIKHSFAPSVGADRPDVQVTGHFNYVYADGTKEHIGNVTAPSKSHSEYPDGLPFDLEFDFCGGTEHLGHGRNFIDRYLARRRSNKFVEAFKKEIKSKEMPNSRYYLDEKLAMEIVKRKAKKALEDLK